MAEAIFQHRIQNANIPTHVSSAGISALVGQPADPKVYEILKEDRIDCLNHRARQLTSIMLRESDLILVMDNEQRREIQCNFPAVYGKVHLLGKWGNFEISDPYKKPKEFFKETYKLIVQGIDQWQSKLWT